MKYISPIVLLLAVVNFAVAQNSPALQSIVDAEKNFSKTSVDQGTRTAFLESFDEKSIAFSGGEPHPGRKDWENVPDGNGYLSWWPVYAEVASSGDFGYTTGPAVFGPDRTTQKVNGGIYYASVWKKNSAGVWKVVADLGSSTYKSEENLTEFKTSSKVLKAGAGDKAAKDEQKVLELDKTYITQLNESNKSFDVKYFSDEARIHRPNKSPIINTEAIASFSEPHKFTFEQTGCEMASSKDMAVTYGKAKVVVSRDGKENTIPVCYMHVWKFENAQWKLVLDVIGG